jgi:hypothetical protein
MRVALAQSFSLHSRNVYGGFGGRSPAVLLESCETNMSATGVAVRLVLYCCATRHCAYTCLLLSQLTLDELSRLLNKVRKFEYVRSLLLSYLFGRAPNHESAPQADLGVGSQESTAHLRAQAYLYIHSRIRFASCHYSRCRI